jgi:lysophospholipase L1-like esterase
MKSRRNFFKAAVAGSASFLIPDIGRSLPAMKKKIRLEPNDIIVFQGDSITDAGRNKQEKIPNFTPSLGYGYCLFAAGSLLNKEANKKLTIFNRGISGNKVFQLKERWQADCLALRPSVLSIHIGVNDYWHTLTDSYNGTVETYEKDYRALLRQTIEAIPDIKLVLCEPFAIPGVMAVTKSWFPAFDGYRAVVKKLAEEFDTAFVPFHTIFSEALKHAPGNYWTVDGVHPTLPGTSLMAQAWTAVVS